MVHSTCVVLLVFLFTGASLGYVGTALDEYVNTFDPAYSYNLTNTTTGQGYTLYSFLMVSQTWQTPEFSSHYVWNHTLWICVPDTVIYGSHGFLFINAGSDGNNDLNGAGLDQLFLVFCAQSQAISTLLYQIPNQPISFPDSGPLFEDAIIAHTFRSFLNDSGANPSQILQFPMTKACVRALDTVQDFIGKNFHVQLETFAVAGASKRGWATWLHTAVDPRVTVSMPIVIPLLNTKANILNEWINLGEWGWALQDYTNYHVFDFAGTPEFDLLMSHVDPLSYNDRYVNKQKLVIDSTLDQFFLLDGPKYFWDQLSGPKWLSLVPNSDHGFSVPGAAAQLAELLLLFFGFTAQNVPLPTVTWEKVYSNSTAQGHPQIKISAAGLFPPLTQISGATVWALNTTRPGFRDFRLNPCPNTTQCFSYVFGGLPSWTSSQAPLAPVPGEPNSFVATMTNLPPIASDITQQHWLGFFIQIGVTVNTAIGPLTLALTSEANIYPDFYPFAPHVPDYPAIGLCNLTVTFDQVQTSQWTDGNSNTFTAWTVTMSNTFDLYSVLLEVDGPITQIWGVTQKSGNTYTIPDYQYQNGVIAANSDNIQFSYIIQSTNQATIKLFNNACFPSTSGCSVKVTPTVTSQWSDGSNAVFQSVSLTVKNLGTRTAANTQIEIDLLAGSVISQAWNLALVSSDNTKSVYTCPLYNLPAGQSTSSCGYIIQNPHATPSVTISVPQTICL